MIKTKNLGAEIFFQTRNLAGKIFNFNGRWLKITAPLFFYSMAVNAASIG